MYLVVLLSELSCMYSRRAGSGAESEFSPGSLDAANDAIQGSVTGPRSGPAEMTRKYETGSSTGGFSCRRAYGGAILAALGGIGEETTMGEDGLVHTKRASKYRLRGTAPARGNRWTIKHQERRTCATGSRLADVGKPRNRKSR